MPVASFWDVQLSRSVGVPGLSRAETRAALIPTIDQLYLAEVGLSIEENESRRCVWPRPASQYPPFAFTEHGAVMAATILSSSRAAAMSVYIVRAFVRLRAMLETNAQLARKLDMLEKSVAVMDATTVRRRVSPLPPQTEWVELTTWMRPFFFLDGPRTRSPCQLEHPMPSVFPDSVVGPRGARPAAPRSRPWTLDLTNVPAAGPIVAAFTVEPACRAAQGRNQ
jgi:hypothetical protein